MSNDAYSRVKFYYRKIYPYLVNQEIFNFTQMKWLFANYNKFVYHIMFIYIYQPIKYPIVQRF